MLAFMNAITANIYERVVCVRTPSGAMGSGVIVEHGGKVYVAIASDI